MQSRHDLRRPLGERQEGVALIITLMVLMLVSVLMVGFFAAVVADTRASGLDRDQTQAYAAAHAGLEQITSDLSTLFTTDFSPNATQIAALRATPPTLPGFEFIAPGGTTGSGYWVAPRFTDAANNPRPEDVVTGSVITSGPYQGFRGIITPYDITVTARSRGGAEVRMRRTLQTVAIPVFQFGMFSETDLAFHAGETFGFGGRVHTNGNLFLANADGNTLTIADRVTAVRDVIRTHLPNGLSTTSGYQGTVRIPTTIASNPANNVYRSLARTEGSLQGTVGSADNPNWVSISTGTYLSNIRNGDTGAKQLDLPLVADLNNDGLPDAQPIELIRRPAQGSNEDTAVPIVYTQRFYAQASVRILLSDTAAEIMSLPTIDTSTPPVSLDGGTGYTPVFDPLIHAPLAWSGGTSGVAYSSGTSALAANTYRSNAGTPLIGGFIKIEIQRPGTTPTNGTWEDVTADILRLGITGRNLADADQSLSTRWNNVPDGASDTCAEPNPNAVIRLQRVRDVPIATANQPCGLTAGALISTSPYDFWPNALYDTREGQTRDGLTTNTMALGGIMHYVELDVNNLRRWLSGAIGTRGTSAKNDNGYILYFSDRRTNKNAADQETAEYGNEDTVNLNSSTGTPNGTLDTGEDFNGNGTLETYGRTARPIPGTGLAPLDSAATPNTQLSTAAYANAALIARANRPIFFRRALKLVNGALGNLPPGFTVASENPVYIQGNYNATSTSVTATTSVPAAIIADAVTTLSVNWNDIRSFTFPTDSLSRVAASTGYRAAIVSGKTLAFPQPSGTSASFGSDGGAHNFIRMLEQWANGPIHRYRGSMVSFFISRQANGSFKCCNQDAYNRGDRDWSFDTEFLLPAKLPPGTPMFRDVNTLTFRQLLRPTQ